MQFLPSCPPPPHVSSTTTPMGLRDRGRLILCTICQVKGVLSLSLSLFLSLPPYLTLSLLLIYLFFLSCAPPHKFFHPLSSAFACTVFANCKTVTRLECRNRSTSSSLETKRHSLIFCQKTLLRPTLGHLLSLMWSENHWQVYQRLEGLSVDTEILRQNFETKKVWNSKRTKKNLPENWKLHQWVF